MKLKVEVRPIERQKWHGKKDEENFTRPTKLEVLVDPITGKYATGLSKEDEKKYGEDLGVDLSNIFNPEKPHPFWSTSMGTLKMQNNTMFFNPELSLDYIKIKNMKASKYVANSMAEYEEGLWPDATHVIYDETEMVEIRASKIAQRTKAVGEAAKLSQQRQVEVIMIILGKNLMGASQNSLVVAMDKVANEHTDEFLKLMESDKESIQARALVEVCLANNILQRKGHKIFYADSNLGTDTIEVADYLNQPENQPLKVRLLGQVNNS